MERESIVIELMKGQAPQLEALDGVEACEERSGRDEPARTPRLRPSRYRVDDRIADEQTPVVSQLEGRIDEPEGPQEPGE